MNIAFNYIKSKVQMVPKIIFVLGGPGAGKGTQCQKIVKEYGFEHLSAGDLLRAERAKEGSAYKDLIEQCIRDGVIVPVEITCRLIENAMDASTNDKFLIDGFPRNKDNLDGWTREMSDKVNLMFVLFFECSQEVCMQRCLDRGAAGSGRSDDNMESLLKRFNTYLNDTMPIINHYEKIGLVRRVDAGVPPDVVFNSVKKIFTDYMAQGDF